MTVKDLKEKLEKYPEDMVITMSDYEELREATIFIDVIHNTAKISPVILKNSRSFIGISNLDEEIE
ncbi:hypothetical protein [Cetobacterium sp.]|uniref:hypothetical protein n=1 Tax=Cetobacterium sp. TaxID=2071632 RepID=UPI003F3E1561